MTSKQKKQEPIAQESILLDTKEQEPGQQNGHAVLPDKPNLLDNVYFAADDNGNAEAVLSLYGETLKYSKALGWLEYTGTHWQRVSDAPAKRRIIQTFQQRAHLAIDARNNDILKASRLTSHNVAACLYMLVTKVTIEDINIFDNEPDLLNCQNGVINLRTGSVTPHYPCQNFTFCSPIAYKPDADVSLWNTFIHEALGSEATVHYLQRCVGYSLTGSTREEKLFYAYGPPRAGKGTFSEVFLNVLTNPVGKGANFLTFVNMKDQSAQNFDLAPLRPARVVVASESNKSQSLNPARIKSLTGGDYISCAFKYGDVFEYRPQFKVWLLSNNPVNGDADDDALWGRVQVFDFPYSRLGSEDITLKERLKQPENLEGFLRWAIDGAVLYHKEGKLSPPSVITLATQSHRDSQDYVKNWLDDCCVLSEKAWTSSNALLASYQQWRDGNGLREVSSRTLILTLKKRFHCVEKRAGYKGIRGLSGIALTTDTTDTTDTQNEQIYTGDCIGKLLERGVSSVSSVSTGSMKDTSSHEHEPARATREEPEVKPTKPKPDFYCYQCEALHIAGSTWQWDKGARNWICTNVARHGRQVVLTDQEIDVFGPKRK